MPGNTAPIFSRVGALGAVRITAANSRSDGTGTIGTDIFLAFSADATNGSFVQRVRVIPVATAAGTAAITTASVARVFISTQSSGATTSADTHLWGETSVPSLTVDGDAGNNPIPAFEIPLNLALPPGHHVLVSISNTPVANSEFKAIAVAGNY